MGGKLSKKKSKDGVDSKKKKSNKKASKNNPRHHGSTMSLPADIDSGVSTAPNPYAKDQIRKAQSRIDLRNELPITPAKPRPVLVKAMYDYKARYNDDLDFRTGDKMEVIDKNNGDWWLVKSVKTGKKGYVPNNYVLPDDNSVETQEWWFNSDRREANKQLMLPGNPSGTFLIRKSKERDAFALSVLDKNNVGEPVIRHYLIRKMDNGGCYIQAAKTFRDLFDLVDFYEKNDGGLRCRLTNPCPKQAIAVPFKELEVKRSDIRLAEKLGAGNFGEVHAGVFRNVVDVAVKSLKTGSMTVEEFLAEAKIMHQLRHPKLVQLMGVCTQGEPYWIITEKMDNGALVDYLRKDMGKTIKFPTMIDIAAQVALGMSYLEQMSFIHRDLRAANILVGQNFIVKVADFGLARILDSFYQDDDEVYRANENAKFPIKWTAPEAASQLKFSIKSDVWSFGILLYEIVTYGRVPYPGIDNTTTLTNVMNGYRMPRPTGDPYFCPEELYDVMKSCWHDKPDARPTFEHLKNVFEDFQVSTETSYQDQTDAS